VRAQSIRDTIDIGMRWCDYIPAIPLELRFANFVDRLNRALGK
jgi:hypothetical protein